MKRLRELISSCTRIIIERKENDKHSAVQKRKETGLNMYELDMVKNHKCPASALFNIRGDPFSTVHCPQSLDTFEHFPLQTTQFS